MNRLLFVILFTLLIDGLNAQGIAINEDGTDPDGSAILDVSSSDKGFLAPRMTTTQRGGITSPVQGLIVYDTDENYYYQYDGASWIEFEITPRGTVSGDEPAAPSIGDKYFDETGGELYIYTTGGWASISQGSTVDSPYGTIDMVFGTATGNSITISSWNEDAAFDGYLILMNYENSFTTLANDEEIYENPNYANNGEQAVFNDESSTEVVVSFISYESIYYFKMVPYSDDTGERVYDNSQSAVFVTTASCTFDSGTDRDTDEFTSTNEAEYTTYHESVESQVCFSYSPGDNTFTMSSNQWPEHYMGDENNKDHIDGKFPVAYVVANEVTRELTLNPTYDEMNDITYVYSELGDTKDYDFYNFGIAINGVEFHPMGVEPWAVLDSDGDPVSSGEENWEWQVRVVFEDDVNLDPRGGHTTSRGEYHYHGDLVGLVNEDGSRHSKIYGFAADGFPIYYKYGYEDPDPATLDTTVVELLSSYQLRTESAANDDERQRSSHPNVDGDEVAGQDYPDGEYDGTYIQDYEYVEGLGDLDECNGRYGVTPEYPDGTYYYVITAAFPITPNCFVGTPKDDFLIGN